MVGQTRALEEAKEALRAFEGSALAAVAESLARTAESLAETLMRLERTSGKSFVAEEELAVEMGYVDEAGAPMKKAFAKAMLEAGVPRHKLTNTRVYYLRDEVEDALRRMDG